MKCKDCIYFHKAKNLNYGLCMFMLSYDVLCVDYKLLNCGGYKRKWWRFWV